MDNGTAGIALVVVVIVVFAVVIAWNNRRDDHHHHHSPSTQQLEDELDSDKDLLAALLKAGKTDDLLTGSGTVGPSVADVVDYNLYSVADADASAGVVKFTTELTNSTGAPVWAQSIGVNVPLAGATAVTTLDFSEVGPVEGFSFTPSAPAATTPKVLGEYWSPTLVIQNLAPQSVKVYTRAVGSGGAGAKFVADTSTFVTLVQGDVLVLKPVKNWANGPGVSETMVWHTYKSPSAEGYYGLPLAGDTTNKLIQAVDDAVYTNFARVVAN